MKLVNIKATYAPLCGSIKVPSEDSEQTLNVGKQKFSISLSVELICHSLHFFKFSGYAESHNVYIILYSHVRGVMFCVYGVTCSPSEEMKYIVQQYCLADSLIHNSTM